MNLPARQEYGLLMSIIQLQLGGNEDS